MTIKNAYKSAIPNQARNREMMAMHIMASLTSVYWDTAQEYETGADLVKCQSETAVEMADALLAELERTK